MFKKMMGAARSAAEKAKSTAKGPVSKTVDTAKSRTDMKSAQNVLNSLKQKPSRPMPPKPSAGGGAPRSTTGLGAIAGRAMPPMKKGGKVASKKAKAK